MLKPMKFKEANKCLTKPQNMTEEECGSLWVYNDGSQSISCWNVPFWKRVKFLLSGKIWLSILSGNTQPPCWVDTSYPFE